jgi:hypothetical protein
MMWMAGLVFGAEVEFAARKRDAGDESVRSMDRHHEAARKSEVG